MSSKNSLVALPRVVCWGLIFLAFSSTPLLSSTARVEGVVLDVTGARLPGALVALYHTEDLSPLITSTDEAGEFSFEALSSGQYTPVASLSGYQEHAHAVIELREGETVRIEITLQFAFSEEVVITENRDKPQPNEPQEKKVIPVSVLDLLPLENDRFTDALPLVPGVVRGPGGRLNFNGARASQSVLLVNGSNVTDPLTGDFAFDLPMKAIDTVEVHSIPYSAEYGRVTAAVAEITTQAGSDEFDIDFGSLWPSIRFRNGKIAGINSATPRVQVSGPLKKGRAWFSQGFALRFVRSRVYDMPVEGADEQILENFDTFTQFDFKLNDDHALTTTFSYFPVEIDNLGLNTLRPENASPDYNSWGWNFAVAEKASLSPRLFIETMFAVKSFDVAVRPKSTDTTLLVPDGRRNNYFNELDRESMRWSFNFACTHAAGGSHVVEFGTNIAHMDFNGTDESGPVEVRGADNSLLQTIEFRGDPRIGANDWEVSGYIQDQWRPISRFGLDLGLRFDYERITGDSVLSPRLAWSFAVREDASTILKGGVGSFVDKVFLHAGSFEQFQQRVETTYGSDGLPVGSPLVFANHLTPEGLDVPRSLAWNLEVNQALGKDWMLRVNYRERRGRNELLVDREEDNPEGPALVLSSRGRSTSKEFDITFRKKFQAEDAELFFSYVKSRTSGDLNNFGEIYGDLREPIFWESEYSRLAFDVPHRFLTWGLVHLPKDIIVVPGVEIREGFPYTIFNEDYSVVGERNRGGRFPLFISIDLRVTKGFRVFGRDVRVGFQLFNMTSRFNPRDIVANLASDDFGTFRNSRQFSGGLKLQMGF